MCNRKAANRRAGLYNGTKLYHREDYIQFSATRRVSSGHIVVCGWVAHTHRVPCGQGTLRVRGETWRRLENHGCGPENQQKLRANLPQT